MTSIALVLSPKSDESRALIRDRIQANLLGGGVGFVFVLLHEPTVVLFSIGVVLTVLLSRQLKIYKTVRSALVAFVIITIPAYPETRAVIAVERLACVVIGCVIALLVTLLADYLLARYASTALERPARVETRSDEA